MPNFDITTILQMFVLLAIETIVFIFFVILAILNRKAFRNYYKTGLIIGIILFVMTLPASVVSIVYYSPSELKDNMKVFIYIGFMIGIYILVLEIGWNMVVYYVSASEWDKIKPSAFTVFKRDKNTPWAQILVSAGLGLILGLASWFIFEALGVKENEWLKKYMTDFTGLKEASAFIRIPIVILYVSVAAVAEELVYRGGLFAFLLRVTRSVLAPILIVSFLWAMLHLINTDWPLVKCAQIFIIGIIFCEIARRSCVESAIAAHLGLNIGAIAMWLVSGINQ